MKLKLTDKMPWGVFKDLTIKEVIDTKSWYWKKYGSSINVDQDVTDYLDEIRGKIYNLRKSLKGF